VGKSALPLGRACQGWLSMVDQASKSRFLVGWHYSPRSFQGFCKLLGDPFRRRNSYQRTLSGWPRSTIQDPGPEWVWRIAYNRWRSRGNLARSLSTQKSVQFTGYEDHGLRLWQRGSKWIFTPSLSGKLCGLYRYPRQWYNCGMVCPHKRGRLHLHSAIFESILREYRLGFDQGCLVLQSSLCHHSPTRPAEPGQSSRNELSRQPRGKLELEVH